MEDPSIVQVAVSCVQGYSTRKEQHLNSVKSHIMAGKADLTAEPVYNHHAIHRSRPQEPCGSRENTTLMVYMDVNGMSVFCLLDSGCESVMVSPDFAQAVRLPLTVLSTPIILQMACIRSKSNINHSMMTMIIGASKKVQEYFDVVNIDYYDVILRIPFLKRFGICLDFESQGKMKVKGLTFIGGDNISIRQH